MGTFDRQMTEPSDPRSLSVYLNKIDTLTAQSDQDQEIQIKDITKKHWKPSETSQNCSTRSCRKPFSFIDRVHHCRRCGDVFCANCLKFKRRLNKLANPDPDGKPYKVCQSCYEEGRHTEGYIRNLTRQFKMMRKESQGREAAAVRGQSTAAWRDRVDCEKECARLIDGFKVSIGVSEVKRTLHEMRSMVSTPEWQKSSVWIQENMAESCQKCHSKFGLFRKKNCCKVCGIAVCKSCSTKDLLVFIPDEREDKDVTPEPKLAVIRYVGCPESEPEISLYLRVCSSCHDHLVDKQVAKHSDEEDNTTGKDLLSQLNIIHQSFSKAEEKVNKHLPEYLEIVESLEDNSRRSGGTGAEGVPKNNMVTLAKAQEDLADFLTQHVMIVQQLKKLKPQTDTQNKLLKNYIRSKCDYYLENMSTFRNLKRKLSDSSPQEVLEFIQRIMDKNAIVNAHLYLRQLVYETIALCGKHKMKETLPMLLAPVEETVEQDVQVCIVKEGEDWEQHKEFIQEMIKTQIKEHKLIRPSRTYLWKHGSKHAKEIMLSRTVEVIIKINLQLQLKAANRRFPATKKALEQVLKDLETAEL